MHNYYHYNPIYHTQPTQKLEYWCGKKVSIAYSWTAKARRKILLIFNWCIFIGNLIKIRDFSAHKNKYSSEQKRLLKSHPAFLQLSN